MSRLKSAVVCWLGYFREPHAWLVFGMLALGGVLHYLDLFFPHLASGIPSGLPRDSMERILFILPVIYAGFIFGLAAGVLTLFVAMMLMTPRALYFSEHPGIVLFEMAAVVVVGGLTLLWFEGQRKEKRQRQQALAELEKARQELATNIEVIKKNQRQLLAMHDVCRVTTQSLELPATLRHIIGKICEVMSIETAMVFMKEDGSASLRLAAHAGLPDDMEQRRDSIRHAELLCQEAVRAKEARGSSRNLTSGVFDLDSGPVSELAVALMSKGEVIGTLFVGAKERDFVHEEIELLSAIGGQAGVAIHNARLYQNTQDSERNYRGLFENASVPMYITDVAGTIMEVNKAFVDMTGYGQTDLVGRNVATLWSPSTCKVAREAEEQLLTGGEIQQPYQVGFVRKDGGVSIVSLSTRLTTEDGAAVAFEHVARDETEQVRMRSSLEFYLRQILTAQEEERTRIARELHDGTAQEMLVLCQQLDRLGSDPKIGLKGEARASIALLRANAIGMLADLRQMAQDLRPHIFDALGLVAALEWLADDLQKQCGIQASVEVIGDLRPMIPEKELLIFRIAQEALRNVRRHSKASSVSLRLEYVADGIRMSAEDNGEGFNIPDRLTEMAYQGKFGLMGMQERVKLLGGKVVVRSSPGQGTTVCAELPDAPALPPRM